MLVGLDVGEIAPTGGNGGAGDDERCGTGGDDRRTRQREARKDLLKADQRANLATRPLPEPESRPWVKQVGLALPKPDLRSLFELIPQETCVAIPKTNSRPPAGKAPKIGVGCQYTGQEAKGCSDYADNQKLERQQRRAADVECWPSEVRWRLATFYGSQCYRPDPGRRVFVVQIAHLVVVDNRVTVIPVPNLGADRPTSLLAMSSASTAAIVKP